MQIIISELELIETPYRFNPMLRILKDKGAPVLGLFFLTPDFDNYTWSQYKQHNGDYVFIIEPIKGVSE